MKKEQSSQSENGEAGLVPGKETAEQGPEALSPEDRAFFANCDEIEASIRDTQEILGLAAECSADPSDPTEEDKKKEADWVPLHPEEITKEALLRDAETKKEIGARKKALAGSMEKLQETVKVLQEGKGDFKTLARQAASQAIMCRQEYEGIARDETRLAFRHRARFDLYKKKVLAEQGIPEGKDFWHKSGEYSGQISKLRGSLSYVFPFSKTRQQVRDLQAQRQQIDDLEKQTNAMDLSSYSSDLWHLKYDLENSLSGIGTVVHNRVKQTFTSLSGLRVENPQRTEAAAQEAAIPEETMRVIVQDELAGYYSRENVDLGRAQALAFAIYSGKAGRPETSHSGDTTVDFATRAADELTSYKRRIPQFLKVVAKIPRIQRAGEVFGEAQALRRLYEQKVLKKESDWYLKDAEAEAKRHIKENGDSMLRDEFGGISPLSWKYFRPQLQRIFGMRKAEETDLAVARMLADQIMTIEDRNRRPTYSQALLDFPQEELIPVAMANCYRETAYSGGYFLLGERSGKVPAVEYAMSVTQAAIENLRRSGKGKLADLIELIRQNPKGATSWYIQNEKGESVESPDFQKANELINDYALSQFERMSPDDPHSSFWIQCVSYNGMTSAQVDKMLELHQAIPGSHNRDLIATTLIHGASRMSSEQQAMLVDRAEGDVLTAVVGSADYFRPELRLRITKRAIEFGKGEALKRLAEVVKKPEDVGENLRHDLIMKLVQCGESYYVRPGRKLERGIEEKPGKICEFFPKEYRALVEEQKRIALDRRLPVAQREIAYDFLARVCPHDAEAEDYFKGILQGRLEKGGRGERLTGEQKTALSVFLRMDNAASNEILWKFTLDDSVSPAVRQVIAGRLFSGSGSFLNAGVRQEVAKWLKQPGPRSQRNWGDISFIADIQKSIPSAETTRKSLEVFALALGRSVENKSGLDEAWKKSCPDIPRHIFPQSLVWADGNQADLGKLNGIFRVIRKEHTMQSDLLNGLLNTLDMKVPLFRPVREKLLSFEYASKKDVEKFSGILKKMFFLNTVYRITSQGEEGEVSASALEGLQKCQNISDMEKLIESELASAADKFFGGKIKWESLAKINEKWDSVQPIFHYAGRFPQLREYIAEMVANFSSEDAWKKWRYDLGNEKVRSQIGFLSDDQLAVWAGNYSAEMGFAEAGASTLEGRPQQIASRLRIAVMQDNHLLETGTDRRFSFVKQTIEPFCQEAGQAINPGAIRAKLAELADLSSGIDSLQKFGDVGRAEEIFAAVFPEGKGFTPSKKSKEAVSFLQRFLTEEQRKQVKEAYEKIKDSKSNVQSDEVLTAQMRQEIARQLAEIKMRHEEASRGAGIAEILGIAPADIDNKKILNAKKEEIRAAADLIRLSALTSADIAENRFVGEEGGKEGKTVSGTFEALAKFFQGTAFAQDVTDAASMLRVQEAAPSTRHIAAIFTDDPEVLWKVGAYPVGCGSCQNYVDGSHASRLMGYVGDAGAKVMYLFDLDKLPDEKKKLVAKKGFKQAFAELTSQEILDASVARSVVKIVKSDSGEPAVLAEPTYTSQNKADRSLDTMVNSFLQQRVAGPMKMRLARMGTSRFNKGTSRSPEGQYEDCSGMDFVAAA